MLLGRNVLSPTILIPSDLILFFIFIAIVCFLIFLRAKYPPTMLLTRPSGGFEMKESSGSVKNQKEMHSLMLYNSCTPAEDLLLMVELRKKILTFRDIIDLPPCNESGSVHELVIRTVEDLHHVYPKNVSSIPSELNRKSTYQVLSKLHTALDCIRDLWMNNHKWLSKFKYDKESDTKNTSLGQLGDRVLAKLDYMIMMAREMFDVMDEDGSKSDVSPRASIFGETLDGSYSSTKVSSCQSPATPTSVLPEIAQSFADVAYSPPLLWPLRLQAVGKLKPIDVKRLSFHMFPHISSRSSSPENEKKLVEEVEPEKKRAKNSSKSLGVTNMNGEPVNHTVSEAMPQIQQANVGLVTFIGNCVESICSPFAPKAPPLPPSVPETKGSKALMEPNASIELQKNLLKDSTEILSESLVLLSREPSLSPITLPPDIPELSPQHPLLHACAETEGSLSPPPPPPPPPPPILLKSASARHPSILESNASAEPHPLLPLSMLQNGTSPAPPSVLPQNAYAASPLSSPSPVPTVSTLLENADAEPPSPVLPTNPLTSTPSQTNASPAPTPPMLQPNASTTPPPPPPPPMSQSNASTAPTPPPPPPPMLQLNASAAPPPPPPPPLSQSNSFTTPPPPPPPMLQQNASTAPPPPPPMLSSKGSAPSPPPPMTSSNGGALPPPPPGAARGLGPKKANTKLKRSSHMGKLYRVLKGKVEGSNQDVKGSSGKKNISGGAGGSGGGKSMADALAEMTKRSSYFQQIEEDVQKHAQMIMEMKTAINQFQTNDLTELVKFHQNVESHLEKLTDETQVLARFEDFPSKKLETLRTAAALYTKLNAMLTTLNTWKIEPPLAGVLDKVENYFNKIKGEVDALDRTKDEECKRFKSHKINLDFNILVRIKEAMVDLSSSCMEFALKERREAKAASDGETGSKTEKRLKACTKMLWRAFQLAFRVYTFAGGHDDRADMLSRELAEEIENEDHH